MLPKHSMTIFQLAMGTTLLVVSVPKAIAKPQKPIADAPICKSEQASNKLLQQSSKSKFSKLSKPLLKNEGSASLNQIDQLCESTRTFEIDEFCEDSKKLESDKLCEDTETSEANDLSYDSTNADTTDHEIDTSNNELEEPIDSTLGAHQDSYDINFSIQLDIGGSNTSPNISEDYPESEFLNPIQPELIPQSSSLSLPAIDSEVETEQLQELPRTQPQSLSKKSTKKTQRKTVQETKPQNQKQKEKSKKQNHKSSYKKRRTKNHKKSLEKLPRNRVRPSYPIRQKQLKPQKLKQKKRLHRQKKLIHKKSVINKHRLRLQRIRGKNFFKKRLQRKRFQQRRKR